tara:strand:- start:164 stop:361 length:198 start_codon:yes stop_codon:yes gene_type:complete
MDPKNPESIKNVLDTALATSFISTPIWLQHVEQSLQVFMLVGGSILLIFRLWAMIKGAKDKEDDR